MKMRSRALTLFGLIALSAISSRAAGADATDAAENGFRIAGPVLMVSDLERSVRFYTEGLGMAVGSRLPGNPGPGVTVIASGGGRSPFILLRQRDREVRSTPIIQIGNGLSRIMLTVADAKSVEARLKAAGYAPSVPNSRNIFFVKDPDGYSYEVMEIHRN